MMFMRLTATLIIGLFCFQLSNAQQITISPISESSENSENEYTLSNRWGEIETIRKFHDAVEFTGTNYTVSNYEQVSVSPGNFKFGFLMREGSDYNVEIRDEKGEKAHQLTEIDTFDDDDPSPKIYVLDNGEVFYRFNISFFRHYDSNGEQIETINNSSDSPEGEMISELKRLPYSNGVLLYNPQIRYGGDQTGSRVQYYDGKGDPEEIFASEDRQIQDLTYSKNGQLLVLHLIDDNTHYSRAVDLNGNTFYSHEYDDFEPVELSVSDDGRYLVSRGSSRVMTHDMHTGESMGSTSIGTSTLSATYSSDLNSMLVLSGSYSESNNSLSNMELRRVDVVERSIDTKEIDGSYHWNQLLPLRIDTRAGNEFRISGINRPLQITM